MNINSPFWERHVHPSYGVIVWLLRSLVEATKELWEVWHIVGKISQITTNLHTVSRSFSDTNVLCKFTYICIGFSCSGLDYFKNKSTKPADHLLTIWMPASQLSTGNKPSNSVCWQYVVNRLAKHSGWKHFGIFDWKRQKRWGGRRENFVGEIWGARKRIPLSLGRGCNFANKDLVLDKKGFLAVFSCDKGKSGACSGRLCASMNSTSCFG